MQLELPGGLAPTFPPGFRHAPDLLSDGEAASLVARLRHLPLAEVRMHGVIARRRVAHFGFSYAYGARTVAPGEPLPGFLEAVRERAAVFAGVPPDALAEALVTRYPPGAGIGWHRDAPAFDLVVAVSLGAPARLQLRRGGPGGEKREVVVGPGSAYVLEGAARWAWQHHLPPVKAERWSVTFRTLRERTGIPPNRPAPRPRWDVE